MSLKLNSVLGGSVTLTEPNTASAFNLTLPTDNIQPGMNLITPTSVVGGTFSGGNISFSAASTLSINGCFTNLYEIYNIEVRCTYTSDNVVNWRLRVNGIDDSSANYDHNIQVMDSLANAPVRSLTQTSGSLGRAGGFWVSTLHMYSPSIAAPTYNCFQSIYGPGVAQVFGTGRHNVSSAFDGFTIIPVGGGTITGTIKVYGMRNQ